MDFYYVGLVEAKNGPYYRPHFIVKDLKDLMVRGGKFLAVWDEEDQLWSKDISDLRRLVDIEAQKEVDRLNETNDQHIPYRALSNYSNGLWSELLRFMREISDCYRDLDNNVAFSNTIIKREDYHSFRLDYPLEMGDYHAWDELVGTLYQPTERAKIEWAIGSIVAGDSKDIQKFMVLYGPPGSGKSTILNVINKLFKPYTTVFDAKALGSSNGTFSTASFAGNPLVAIQHDGDLSKLEDNTRLNSIVSHEEIEVNEKFKAAYTQRMNSFLFMGTNQPVKISDARSGIIRRLIDIAPSGVQITSAHYDYLMNQIDFELGAIAEHCLVTYRRMGKQYYEGHRAEDMMMRTDEFYNFVEAHYDLFKDPGYISLKQVWTLYREYCDDQNITRRPQYQIRDELRNYFHEFHRTKQVEGTRYNNLFVGFKGISGQNLPLAESDHPTIKIELDEHDSLFDVAYADAPAQYAKPSGWPGKKWAEVTTTLSDIDTEQLHYVQVPENHIVIDFDLVDEDGEKDLDRNIRAAELWPTTYTELSKSGKGLHLHYTYVGDVHELSSVYDIGIEVKTLLGNAALRRKLTLCNDHEIMSISSNLPKKEKRMIDTQSIQSEKGLRDMIVRNLKKEIHPGTKPSIDFIVKILNDAYESELNYDVQDLRPKILSFAAGSTNQSNACIKAVKEMRFVSEHNMVEREDDDSTIIFYDVEVYPNLFVICWKYQGKDPVVKMINPDSRDVEALLSTKLVGFNNRRYDNHILYGAYLGYSNEELFKLSQEIIDNNRNVMFGEAYNLSYADIYDFSSKKQGLKKFQIELGIKHVELDLPWDEPVDESMWDTVVEYCVNDVIATEKVFEARKQDFVAREILSSLSGLSPNHTTQNHTARILFGENKYPQSDFVYTDLSEQFEGYEFDGKESVYRGESPGEGGYVYAEPGMYSSVALLDVASMHPTSIELLNLFGPYTKAFSELKEARMAIKHKDYDKASSLLDGKLGKFLGDAKDAEALSYALKIVINIVYGLTSARFNNPFKDNRNMDNIVAKRGALFMIDLMKAVQDKGFTVAHIKTDSIKIPEATPEIIEFVFEFGKEYGYDFEHEITYDKLCLVNNAVYVARKGDKYTAVGAQFQHPYVYKTLFTQEPMDFDDYCETKSVREGTMYIEKENGELKHVGRTNSFVPVENDGGILWRIKEDKRYAVTGTKGYKWIERETAAYRSELDELEIDMAYFHNLTTKAIEAIEEQGSLSEFVD